MSIIDVFSRGFGAESRKYLSLRNSPPKRGILEKKMSIPKNKMNSERGFTLIEVLISTAVLAILVSALMLVINQINQSSVTQRARMNMLLESHIAAVNLETQLRRIVQPDVMGDPASEGWRFLGENNAGDFSTNFGMETEYQGCSPNSYDQLSSYVSHYEVTSTTTGVSDRRSLFVLINEGGVVVEECALMVRNRSHDQSDLNNNQSFPDLDNDESNISGMQTLAENVDMLLFRYYDANADQWLDQWDSDNAGNANQHNQLPDAIEYAFRSFDPDGHASPIWFRGTISLKNQQE